MGDVIVKIKDNHAICQTGTPRFSSNQNVPKFECKVQGVVIQGVDLLSLPICENQDDARTNFNLTTDDLFWYSLDTDEGVPYTLARVRPI